MPHFSFSRLPLIPFFLSLAAAAVLSAADPATGQAVGARVGNDPDAGKPRIQVAILLDDSGSMSGLLSQAKQQIWDMINQLATTRYQGKTPLIEVALYHYGDLPFAAQPLLPLTRDLDAVSQQLNTINGGGGTEACGLVISNAATQLAWSDSRNDLKLIIIAGNEAFTQGRVAYTTACATAIAKGIQVNTIHCGPEAVGRQGEWDKGAALADGTFLNIDQNQVEAPIAAPQDGEIAELNGELNATYLAYGAVAEERQHRQALADNDAQSGGSFYARAAAKSSSAYRNAEWDLVDAARSGTASVAALPEAALPAVLRACSTEKKMEIIASYSASRAAIQTRIQTLATARNAFVTEARAKAQGTTPGQATFGQAVRVTIAEQARKKGYVCDVAGTNAISSSATAATAATAGPAVLNPPESKRKP